MFVCVLWKENVQRCKELQEFKSNMRLLKRKMGIIIGGVIEK